MVNDPCNGEIVTGLHGTSEGIGQRFVTNFTPAGSATSGYIVWFPSMHCGIPGADYTSQARPLNSYFWNNNDLNLNPLNTTAAPFGSGQANTASAVRDPFFNTADSSSVLDGRTLAACLKVRPTNSVSTIQGTISYLDNIPSDLFDLSSAGGVAVPPTINQMLAYSRRVERLGIDTYEVKHRPSDTDRFFSPVDGVSVYNNTVTATTTTAIADSIAPRGIGFVFTGVTAASSLLFTLYKVVEWRPAPSAGVPIPRPISMPVPPLHVLLSQLDGPGSMDWMFTKASDPMVQRTVRAAWALGNTIYNNPKPYKMITY